MTVDIEDPFGDGSVSIERAGGDLIQPGVRIGMRGSWGTVQPDGSFTWDAGAFPAPSRPTPPEGWSP